MTSEDQAIELSRLSQLIETSSRLRLIYTEDKSQYKFFLMLRIHECEIEIISSINKLTEITTDLNQLKKFYELEVDYCI